LKYWSNSHEFIANMYFEFSYENNTQYDFLCIFETLGCMQHKKSFFIVFLRVKKNWGLKGVFPKKILKKKQKNGDFMFLCFFILSFSLFSFYPFFCFFRLRRPERVDPVELTWLGLTRSSQLKKNRRKETKNKTNQKWKKTQKLENFSIKNESKQNIWMFFVSSQNVIFNPEQILNKEGDVSVCNPPWIKN
jgi:hypothetical protein